MSMLYMAALAVGQLAHEPAARPPPPAEGATRLAADLASDAAGPPALRRGSRRVSFGILTPSGGLGGLGAAVGGGLFVADRLAVTFLAQLDIDRQQVIMPTATALDTVTDLRAGLAPGVRYYFAAPGPVGTFVAGGLLGGYSRVAQRAGGQGNIGTGSFRNDGFLHLMGSFGAEWWPAAAVSLSGELGFRLEVVRDDNQPAPAFRTLATALQANFYW